MVPPLAGDDDGGRGGGRDVVFATQYPVLDRTLHFARLRANRSYAIAYRASDPPQLTGGMYLSLDSPARSLRTAPDPGGDLLVVGGNDHATGRGGSTRARVDDLDAWARHRLGVGEPLWSWSAQDYRTMRQVPSVGAVPGTDGSLLVATGFDKWGMTNAVAAAHVLAGDLLKDPPEYAGGLRSAGLGPRDVVESVRHNGSVGVRWMTDRLARVGRAAPRPAPPDGEGRVEGGPTGPTAVSTVDGRTCRVSAVCTHLGGVVVVERRRAQLGLPAPRVAVHGIRRAPRGPGDERPRAARRLSAGVRPTGSPRRSRRPGRCPSPRAAGRA